MKAVVLEEFGSPEVLVMREIDDPRPSAHEVIIEVAASAVNFPDVLVVAGTYQILPDLPFTPGKEIAGVIRELGSAVTGLAIGDRVTAQLENGGYAQRVAVAQELVVAVPDDVPLDVAATTGLVYTTAAYALRQRAGLRAGETVLVTGATGGVGAAAVQLAKAWGATVIAAATADRADQLKDQGADHVVSPEPTTLRDQVRAVTGGRGVDIAIEAIGGDLFTQVVRSMAWEGRLVVVGFASGEVPSIKTGHLLVKNIGVSGLQVSDYRERDPQGYRDVIAEILELVRIGRLDVPIVARFPLDEAHLALGGLADRTIRGRIILEP